MWLSHDAGHDVSVARCRGGQTTFRALNSSQYDFICCALMHGGRGGLSRRQSLMLVLERCRTVAEEWYGRNGLRLCRPGNDAVATRLAVSALPSALQPPSLISHSYLRIELAAKAASGVSHVDIGSLEFRRKAMIPPRQCFAIRMFANQPT